MEPVSASSQPGVLRLPEGACVVVHVRVHPSGPVPVNAADAVLALGRGELVGRAADAVADAVAARCAEDDAGGDALKVALGLPVGASPTRAEVAVACRTAADLNDVGRVDLHDLL